MLISQSAQSASTSGPLCPLPPPNFTSLQKRALPSTFHLSPDIYGEGRVSIPWDGTAGTAGESCSSDDDGHPCSHPHASSSPTLSLLARILIDGLNDVASPTSLLSILKIRTPWLRQSARDTVGIPSIFALRAFTDLRHSRLFMTSLS